MASLQRMASQLQKQKLEAGKLKKRGEREFLKAQSIAKKSTSGLASLQRRIESSRELLGGVSSVLTQRLAQQESIQRLIAAAEVRLNHEKEAKEQTEQELEYSTSKEEKQHAQDRLRTISDRINELIEELKQRNKMTKKVIYAIEDYQKSKSRISTKIQNQTRSKPTLQKLIKKSKKTTSRLAKQVASKTRQEQSAKQNLTKINKKLAELAKKRKKRSSKGVSKKKKIKAKIKSKKKKLMAKGKKKIKTKRKTSKKIRQKNKKKTKKAKQKKRSKSRRRK